jgi:glucose/arabinose dehydrogenase
MRKRGLIGAAVFLLCGVTWATASTLPAGFVETFVVETGLSPTASAHTPDGRILLGHQDGTIQVVKNGAVLPTPFATLDASTTGERGLLGLTLDRNFTATQAVYVYYSADAVGANRLSRLVANGDVALPEEVLVQFPSYGGANLHMGGALVMGNDDKLYVALGDHVNPSAVQSLATHNGKLMRFNADGTIPTDNPFYMATTGLSRAIFALGLRSPFSGDVDRVTGRILINDVGSGAGNWEEINEVVAGANYGWPVVEGPASNPSYVDPVYAYDRSGGCAIAGGAFYRGATFPGSYVGGYFFTDFCQRWIRWLDPVTDLATGFATSLTANANDLDVGPDGNLYYLARIGVPPREDDTGDLYRISFGFPTTTVSSITTTTVTTTTTTLTPPVPATSSQGGALAGGLLALTMGWALRRADLGGEPGGRRGVALLEVLGRPYPRDGMSTVRTIRATTCSCQMWASLCRILSLFS